MGELYLSPLNLLAARQQRLNLSNRGAMPELKNKAHEAFCQQYVLNGGVSRDAYCVAYPKNRSTPKSQSEQACKLKARPEVNRRINELLDRTQAVAREQFNIDATYVLRRLIEMDQLDVADILDDNGCVLPPKQWPKPWRRFITSIDLLELNSGEGVLKKIKWPDKVKNLEMLGRHISVNAFKQVLEHTGPGGGPIQTITTEMTPAEAAEAYADTLREDKG